MKKGKRGCCSVVESQSHGETWGIESVRNWKLGMKYHVYSKFRNSNLSQPETGNVV